MAATRPLSRARLRTLAIIAALLAFGWLGYQTFHAGSEVPPAQKQELTKLSAGSAGGKRIDGRSWSLDYESATMTPDGQGVEVDKIRDGIILKNGAPYARMIADHVTANIAANSFTVRGTAEFTELAGQHRQITTTDARYSGTDHILTLDHPSTIREGPGVLTVDKATMNFATGETKLGRISGTL